MTHVKFRHKGDILMKIEFKNNQLASIANMLLAIDVAPKNALAISRMVKLLSQKNDEYGEDEHSLAELFCETDGFGQFKEDSSGNLVAKQGFELVDFVKEQAELQNTDCVVDLTEYKPYFPKLKKALNDVTTRLSGENLIAYAILVEKLEEVTEL